MGRECLFGILYPPRFLVLKFVEDILVEFTKHEQRRKRTKLGKNVEVVIYGSEASNVIENISQLENLIDTKSQQER